MLRITLGGEGFADFPAGQQGAYVKLVFPQTKGSRPLLRTYTVRHQSKNTIDIDFALHDAKGPASSWAVNATAGDNILVGGPGPRKELNYDSDWFLLCGDMTALPAISVNLTLLPKEAKGYAVLEVTDEADIQNLAHPDQIQVFWVVKKTSIESNSLPLLEKIQQLTPLEGNLSVWVATEFSSMKAIRRYLKSTFDLPKSHFYTSSYWKLGASEDQHKIAKKADSAS